MMILLTTLILAIFLFLALVALYISFTLGMDLNEENEALQERLKEIEKELKFQIDLKKMYEIGYDKLKQNENAPTNI